MTVDQQAPAAANERFPGTRDPDRQWRLEVAPELALAVHEWGSDQAPPLLLAHGGADFARTFDRFAPLLAEAGWRVISWDHRGHGDSDRAALYSWRADVRDARQLLEHIVRASGSAVRLVGHSKGGGLFSHLAAQQPEVIARLVNIDGIPWRRPSHREVDEATRIERRDGMNRYWLDHRRRSHEVGRKPGTASELAERRAKMNPRLSAEWLRYLVTVGARRAEDGWRWKLDPIIRMGGIGPWRPSWGLHGLRQIQVPMMAILGRQQEPMGWGTDPDGVAPYLPEGTRIEVFDDSGHFVHIEHPQRVADLVLEFLGEVQPLPVAAESQAVRSSTTKLQQSKPSSATVVRHGRLELALHPIRSTEDSPSEAPALLVLPGLGESALEAAGTVELEPWPGPVYALDWSGHHDSQWASGGGYSTESLLGDVDCALRDLGSVTLYGRGLGAYVALLAQGARPSEVHGVILSGGAGLRGGGEGPPPLDGAVESAGCAETSSTARVDPLALLELADEVRPAGFARLFVRQAESLSGLEQPIHVDRALTEEGELPSWLQMLVEHPAVQIGSGSDGLRRFASARSIALSPA